MTQTDSMALAQFVRAKKAFSVSADASLSHVLTILPADAAWLASVPDEQAVALQGVLTRRRMRAQDMLRKPVCTVSAEGVLTVWIRFDATLATYERLAGLRAAVQRLLEEAPERIALNVHGDATTRELAVADAAYVLWINGARLPEQKTSAAQPGLKKVTVYGELPRTRLERLRAIAAANVLCRSLTVLPPNRLAPAQLRREVATLAGRHGWQIEEYDLKKLRKLGAGAFVAVAQGSQDNDAAIVRLGWQHPQPRLRVALVGKGICFDTGGHNLKPARHMHGMHEDMNGAAVALGILHAVSALDLPIALDVWLAIARNDVSPQAYRQNDIVTALNGTTIEIVHTDAEGRMALADALTLAARERPDVMADFATLTGSMVSALGNRYSGVLGNHVELLRHARSAGETSGERVCIFPMDEDYDTALESKVADVKQCTLEGDADHILAACFLARFVDGLPWLHMDLSACNCKDGLGAVGSDVTGFGVAWGVQWLEQLLDEPALPRRDKRARA